MNELVGAGVIRSYALFGAESVTPEELSGLAGKQGLEEAWKKFAARFLGG